MIKGRLNWEHAPAFKRLGLPLLVFALASCATVTKGTHETIEVITEPPGALAYTDIVDRRSDAGARYIGCQPTPCSFRLPRRKEAVILIERDGYAPYEAAVFTENRGERRYRAKKRAEATKNNSEQKGAIQTLNVDRAAGTSQPLGETRDGKANLIRGNVALSSGASAGILGAAAIAETGTVLAAPVLPSLVIGGGMVLYGVASFTLAADTTDTMTGANNSLYPNPLQVRLSKNGADYAEDPNVAGVRQRRKTPSPKAALSRTAP